MGILAGLKSDVVARVTKILGVQTAVDGIKLDLKDGIQPVLDVNPKPFINFAISSAAGSGTITVLDSIKQFVLTGINLTGSDIAQSNVGNLSVTATLESGMAVKLAAIDLVTGAADSASDSLYTDFSHTPIKLKKGSNITVSSTVGSQRVTILGYYEEDL